MTPADRRQFVQTQIRLPRQLHARLKKTAEERVVGINYLVVRALEDFLNRLPHVDGEEESA